MTRIDQLLSFCTVVELKSFSLAAERLGLTQPMINLQIKALESEFSAELLHRETHHILPTTEGEIVYENSLKILALYEKTRQAVFDSGGNLSGRLTIGASSSPADYPMPLLLGKFKSEHKEIEAGTLKEIRVEGLDICRQIFICYNRMLPMSNICKQFLAFAK